jgi:hypothetical protein
MKRALSAQISRDHVVEVVAAGMAQAAGAIIRILPEFLTALGYS